MTTIATRAGPSDTQAAREPRALGLSGRLILLTMSFVMIAEIMIFIPSAISFRRAWLNDKVMGAKMIALSLSAIPSGSRSGDLEAKLLEGLKGAQAIGVRGPGTPWLLTAGDAPPVATREIDLRRPTSWLRLQGLFRSLFLPPHSAVRIIGDGMAGVDGVEWVELVVDEAPLKRAVLDYTRDFLVVSLLISGVTGALLYLALYLLVIRPVRRLSGNIAAFETNPEDASRIMRASGRRDEIGRAEEALARMETALAGELRQRRHLAELGLAVSKINHELRNMLTTAQLLGDRLDESEDPAVRRIAPRLVRTLARAIDFCQATLSYGRASERAPQRRLVPLKPLVEEQLDLTALSDGIPIAVDVAIPDGLLVDADPDQLARVLLNLMRNAVEALSRARTSDARIDVSAERRDGSVTISVADNGPGVPERIRGRLFSAFQASERSGGTGLGLPVAEELVRLHGGRIALDPTVPGARFVVVLPDRSSPERT